MDGCWKGLSIPAAQCSAVLILILHKIFNVFLTIFNCFPLFFCFPNTGIQYRIRIQILRWMPMWVSFLFGKLNSLPYWAYAVGVCAAWHILLVPLLTDRFTQVPLLKAIIRSMLSGCRWYFPDQIQLEMFTKNASFVPIRDPILLPELDIMVGHQNKFLFWNSCLPVEWIQILNWRPSNPSWPMAQFSANGHR